MFSRTIDLIGEEKFNKISRSNILVIGVGGVGGYAVEMLARVGVNNLTIIDGDVVSKSNINRQIIALNSTVGKSKVDVFKERILDINPNANVTAINLFLTKENVNELDFTQYDYIIDAIDNMTAKIEIIKLASKNNVKIISCLSAGNKMDSSLFEIDDIYNTSVCPLARVLRKKLKENDIEKLTVIYSKEEPYISSREPKSICFCPSVMGIKTAEYVIKELIKD